MLTIRTSEDGLFDAYTTDWLHLLARWFHIITGAAWIGTSFYFIWLNNSIRPPESPEDEGENVKGVVWSIHGGAFYRTTKYDGAPVNLPKTLHWFKWEAYLTWISGVSLLALIYWTQAQAFMVDPQVADLSSMEAVGIGVGVLIAGWVGYDILCKTMAKTPVLLACVGLVLLTGLAYWLTNTLSPRAAYIHVGAIMGTIMAANVFVIIIPNQKIMVDAMLAGDKPDVSKGADGALRSLHNNYLTLPVLFIMVSNHFPFTFGSEASWAVLISISILGAGIRHWFNLHGQGHNNAYILPAAAVGMIALAFAMKPATPEIQPKGADWCEVQPIFQVRCVGCHSATPTNASFPVAPLGLMMDTPEQIAARKDDIYGRSVLTKTMPLGNITGMTDEERRMVAGWYNAGGNISDCTVTVPPEAKPGAETTPAKAEDAAVVKPTEAPPTKPKPVIEPPAKQPVAVAPPPKPKPVPTRPLPEGMRPTSCGPTNFGAIPVDCTKHGDTRAYCVLSSHCWCSGDDGFTCEKPANDSDPSKCAPGSSCVRTN
jgi:uncharacterized membrane protein